MNWEKLNGITETPKQKENQWTLFSDFIVTVDRQTKQNEMSMIFGQKNLLIVIFFPSFHNSSGVEVYANLCHAHEFKRWF